MKKTPINLSLMPEFEVCDLTAPNAKEEGMLTVKWKGRVIVAHCPVVEENSESASASFDQQAYKAQLDDKLTPLQIKYKDKEIIVYISGGKTKGRSSDYCNLLDVIRYEQMQRNLVQWLNEEGINLEEQTSRAIARDKILECYENKREELDLHGLQLSSLPECIAEFDFLQKLCLYANQIRQVPESLFNLTALKELDLRKNPCTVLPESLEKLSSLKTFGLRGNLVDVTIYKKILNELKNWCQAPEIEYDQKVRRSMASMRILDCYEKSESVLYLKGLRITSLPDCISELSCLRKLYLEDNFFQSLPLTMAQLPSELTIFIQKQSLPQKVIISLQQEIARRRSENLSAPQIEFTPSDRERFRPPSKGADSSIS